VLGQRPPTHHQTTRAQQRDNAVPLAEVPDGHRAMDHRSALKVRVTF
jgi:hypothetical protein